MALRSIILAGLLAGLLRNSVDALPSTSSSKATTSGFAVNVPIATSRKRPRGCWTTGRSAGWVVAATAARPTNAIQAASAGSFVANSEEGAWGRQGAAKARRRGAHGSTMWFIHCNPPPADDLIHGFAQAIAFGIMGTMLPKLTKERMREKEAGIEADDIFETEEPPDYYGYAEGYVCSTCDNTNEVPCTECRGKGFFVSESALPKKCGYCAGLGTLNCPECDARRETLEQEREGRRTPLRLPPARDDDIDWPFSA